MSLLPATSDYSDRDFDAIVARLQALVRSVHPDWTDFEVANFGNLLLECWGFNGDVVHFYLDNQARECRFATTQHRRNMLALCRLINYDLPGASAATVDLTIRLLNGPLPGPVVLPGAYAPSPCIVRTLETANPIRGQLRDGVTIPAGATAVVATWEHALTRVWNQACSGLPDFALLLPEGPYLDASARVSTTGDGAWAEADNLLDSGPLDRNYQVVVDHYDRAELRFGDGLLGKIPTGNLTARYKVGGGLAGNVEPNALRKVEGSYADSFGNPAVLEVTNLLKASGGYPREEVAAARVHAPASLRALSRTVAREDYEINALRVAGVGRALMLTSNEDEGIPENSGRLFIIPKSGGYPSQALKDDVYECLTVTYPKTVTFQLDVCDPIYLPINIAARVWLREGYTGSAAAAQIAAALAAFFAPLDANGNVNPGIDWGFNYKDANGDPAGEIAWSDVFDVVKDCACVRKVEAASFLLNDAQDDVTLGNHLFPALGTLALIDGATGTALA